MTIQRLSKVLLFVLERHTARRSIAALLLSAFILIASFSSAQQTCQPDGDVDQNGSVTAADALLAFQQALRLVDLSACQQTIADVFPLPTTPDGTITASDALCIFQKALGLPSCLDTLPPPNEPPIADAGVDQMVDENEVVTLSGSGMDSDGTVEGFSWMQTGGTLIALTGAETRNASFSAPEVESDESLMFQLTVTDDDGASATDTVTIMVSDVVVPNAPPTANAGADQRVAENAMVSLTGSGEDSDGTVENFSWMQTGGTPVALSGAETRSASFSAPEVESDENLMFQLTVTDDDGASATDTVTITVRDSPGVLVGEVSGHTVFEGGTAEFTVSLASQPSAKVTIPIRSSDPSQGVAEPVQLVFTSGDWDRYQTVTVEGTSPDAVIGEQDFVIELGPTQSSDALYNGIQIAAVDMNVFELPLRAVHASGNWGANWKAVRDWEASGRSEPLIPLDHIAYLKRLHVNWVGLSVALHYDDSMDSTVERVYSSELDRDRWHIQTPTFADDVLRQFMREFKAHGINVYLTLAFEAHEAETAERSVYRGQLGDPGTPETGLPNNGHGGPGSLNLILPEYWPWQPDHPDHERFVAEFWETYAEQAVHFARIAEEEGVRLYSLGTETDRLFRTRAGGYQWTNHFRAELTSMVESVRDVYSGLLTYDMWDIAVISRAEFYGPGSDHLWDDLDLDVVGLSAWFPLTDSLPSMVTSLETLEAIHEQIFRDYLIPLAEKNPGRPIVFLERGATDNVQAPGSPSGGGRSWAFRRFEFSDADGNGLDDGRETQGNMYGALLNTMNKYPGVVNGVFWWDNWVGAECPPSYRGYPICGKLSEEVVRSAYESFR